MKNKSKKILFVRFSSIGDIVLAHPVIQEYKKLHPDYSIHFATKDVYLDLVKNSPFIDKAFYLKTSRFHELLHLVRVLRREKYDVLIDLHNSLRSRMLRLLLLFSVKHERTFRKSYIKRWLLIFFKWNLFRKKSSVIEAYGRAAGIRVKAENQWDYHLLEEDKKAVLPFIQKDKKFHLAIMASARWNTKAWPSDYYIELLEYIKKDRSISKNIFLYFLGGDGDRALNDEIIRRAAADKFCLNMAGKLSINRSAALLSNMNLFFTNDTGLMHIAGGVHTPLLAVFGCTVRQFGFYPFQDSARIIESMQSCRPCTAKGRDSCPLKHFKCMREIKALDVFHKIKDYIIK